MLQSMDDLVTDYADFKYGHSKSMGITRSVSAIASTFSSCLLIWMVSRSDKRLSTTYNRLLLGLSIVDIIYSLSNVTFNVMAPRDMDYMVWNARGNLKTCNLMGFLHVFGMVGSPLYSCSLNLFYLAKIKYNQTDDWIRFRLEPFCHLVPILLILIPTTVMLITGNINEDTTGACCVVPTYDPPHCEGYEDGEIPEGFEIPCGRGRAEAATFTYAFRLFIYLALPVVVGVSLGMIYLLVSKQDRQMARYGAGSLSNIVQKNSCTEASSNDGKSNNGNTRKKTSNSHAVMHKAFLYSFAYFLSWSWLIIITILKVSGVWTSLPVAPKWQLAIMYLYLFFTPLNGLFNFIIYLHPKVVTTKRAQENISWSRALAIAFWSGISGGNTRTAKVAVLGSTQATVYTKKSTASTHEPKSEHIELSPDIEQGDADIKVPQESHHSDKSPQPGQAAPTWEWLNNNILKSPQGTSE